MSKKTKKGSASVPKPVSKRILQLIIAVLAFLLYSNTFSHQFTLDDEFYFLKHKAVAKGLSGIGDFFSKGSMEDYSGETGVQPYRPVTLLSFALQKSWSGYKPGAAHATNVLLYAILCVVAFSLLCRLFRKMNPVLAAGITLLFMVHPVHAEVVASIKSRDEILAALFGLGALLVYFGEGDQERSWARILVSTFLFGLSVFSKESAIALVLIFPLADVMLRKTPVKKVILSCLPIAMMGGLYLLIRQSVVGGEYNAHQMTVLENILFGAKSFAEQVGTRFEILWVYLRLLLFPLNLSWDYSYNQVPVMSIASPIAILSLLLHLALMLIAILNFRRRPEISFGILFYFIALFPVSNILLPIGTTVAERFLFLPSFGFAIAIVAGIVAIAGISLESLNGSRQKPIAGILLVVCLVFAILTVNRSALWSSNQTLLEDGIKNAPLSARTHSALASEYRIQAEKSPMKQDRDRLFNQAASEYLESIRILPKYTFTLYNLGLTYQEMGDTVNAFRYYRATLNENPKHEYANNNLATLYQGQQKYDSALVCAQKALEMRPKSILYRQNVAIFNFYTGNYDKAESIAHEILQEDPSDQKSKDILSECARVRGLMQQK